MTQKDQIKGPEILQRYSKILFYIYFYVPINFNISWGFGASWRKDTIPLSQLLENAWDWMCPVHLRESRAFLALRLHTACSAWGLCTSSLFSVLLKCARKSRQVLTNGQETISSLTMYSLYTFHMIFFSHQTKFCLTMASYLYNVALLSWVISFSTLCELHIKII